MHREDQCDRFGAGRTKRQLLVRKGGRLPEADLQKQFGRLLPEAAELREFKSERRLESRIVKRWGTERRTDEHRSTERGFMQEWQWNEPR